MNSPSVMLPTSHLIPLHVSEEAHSVLKQKYSNLCEHKHSQYWGCHWTLQVTNCKRVSGLERSPWVLLLGSGEVSKERGVRFFEKLNPYNLASGLSPALTQLPGRSHGPACLGKPAGSLSGLSPLHLTAASVNADHFFLPWYAHPSAVFSLILGGLLPFLLASSSATTHLVPRFCGPLPFSPALLRNCIYPWLPLPSCWLPSFYLQLQLQPTWQLYFGISESPPTCPKQQFLPLKTCSSSLWQHHHLPRYTKLWSFLTAPSPLSLTSSPSPHPEYSNTEQCLSHHLPASAWSKLSSSLSWQQARHWSPFTILPPPSHSVSNHYSEL